jgi:sugar phosphate isomerase/epimerase
MSEPGLFPDLFWQGIDHIEIGEFPDEAAFHYFLKLMEHRQLSYGVHSPLFRSGSKYDLIQSVYVETEAAWQQLEREAERLSKAGASYILVHFPYFKGEVAADANELIEAGLQRLSALQSKYAIPFVCEPKLGLDRSAAGICYLHDFPLDVWQRYGMKLCIDVGDYCMATGPDVMTYLRKWENEIKVVHLHNVLFTEDKYWWVPVHPSQEEGGYYKLEPLIRYLSRCGDVTFVFEHTPHSKPSKPFVEEGVGWVRTLLHQA